MTFPYTPILALLISLSLFSPPVLSEKCHPNDKKALLQIRKDLNYPYTLIAWDPKTDCCVDWNKNLVKCDVQTNRVTHFTIQQADLHLPIPAAIGDLPYLQHLTFHRCNASGEIPQSLSKLSNLNFLDLRQNLLTGPVPSFLGTLKKLTYIGLSRNGLTGSIPPEIGYLPELGGLLLDRNNLTGGIPESFGDFNAPDFYLYMSRNQLSGPIPTRLGNAKNFVLFDVSRNRLEGDVSFMFGKNKSLSSADFSRNLLEFDFSNVVEFPKGMYLDLNHNKIFGRLPAGLAEFDVSVNVSYNRLCGRIPVGGRLQELDSTAFFHNRCLCGSPLPACK